MTIEGRDLTDGIRSGDPEAQRIVVETYLPQIIRVSRAAGLDGAPADDVAQSTFLTLFEKSATFDGCLESVPTPQRMGFVRREVEGLTSEEICKILKVTRTNLGVRFFRARNRLWECVEARGMAR